MVDERDKLHSAISVKLNVVNVKMSRQIGQAVQSNANLRLPEWRIISLLATSGSMSQANIRGSIGMDKGQISRTVKTMLTNDLLEFEGQEGQSRNVRLRLTDKGRGVHTGVDAMMEEHKAHVFSTLSEDDKRTLYDWLIQIEKSVDNWIA